MHRGRKGEEPLHRSLRTEGTSRTGGPYRSAEGLQRIKSIMRCRMGAWGKDTVLSPAAVARGLIFRERSLGCYY